MGLSVVCVCEGVRCCFLVRIRCDMSRVGLGNCAVKRIQCGLGKARDVLCGEWCTFEDSVTK